MKAIESPNPKIDAALESLMASIDTGNVPLDTAVKIINSAISWEKVKHHVTEKDAEFDPDLMDT